MASGDATLDPINTQLYTEVATTIAPDASAETPREFPGGKDAEEREYAPEERDAVLVHRRGGDIQCVGLVAGKRSVLKVPGLEDNVPRSGVDTHTRRVRGKIYEDLIGS